MIEKDTATAKAALSRARLVGFVGATGSGKTTLATKLVEDFSFVRVHMGQPIKNMLASLGLTSHQLSGPPEERRRPSALLDGKSPRYAMETLGTDWGRRMISPRIWANAVESTISSMEERHSTQIVIDDLRFPSDWEVVSRLGGVLVRINRPGVSTSRTSLDVFAYKFPLARNVLLRLGAKPRHETEYHWHDAPAAVDLMNDGSPDDLLRALIKALGPQPMFNNGSDRP
jgi:hypothetical protein